VARPVVASSASSTLADVDCAVLRTLEPTGALYFAWMSVIGLLLTAGIIAWT
jgi:hypothetical protein